ncbi:MAG: endopeptidase La, partial [Nitrospirota bacterium]
MSDTTLTTLPVLPVKRTVLFPGVRVPLTVGRDRSVAAVEFALKTEEKTVLIVSQRDPETSEPTLESLYQIGTTAVIKQVGRTADGQLHAVVQGVERCVLLKAEQTTPFLMVRARQIPAPSDSGPEIDALHRAIVDLVDQLPTLIQMQGIGEVAEALRAERNPVAFAYRVASLLNLTVDGEQALLEAPTCAELLRKIFVALSHEVQVLQLRNKIASDAQAEMGKSQREYLLRQQLKAIQQELGEDGGDESDVGELKKRVEEAGLPEHVRKEADRELGRLTKIPAASPEHQVIRSYLELLLELPWSKTSVDSLELPRVRQVLDEDHYGIQDVKERIVEHLAVLKLNAGAKAPILCLVGPPGVGKTSLGQSIARALGRRFERISLGGVHDEAELRGHRRTYVGAMPGRIIQAIRRAGVKNPVLMLDEVDKMGRDFRGDPAAALLEVLDPAQNHTFTDHYVDLPFDLSQVFFITTANTLDPVSEPLLDRMEIIRLPGYSEYEKREIAKRYLWPRRLKEAGLSAEQVQLADEMITEIICRYTREAGVRQLEQMLGRLTRKIAVQLADREVARPLERGSCDPLQSKATGTPTSPLTSASVPQDASVAAGVGREGAGEEEPVPAGDGRAGEMIQPAPEPGEAPMPIIIDRAQLAEWLGTERFMPEEARKQLPAGVATGLAWTASGGDVLYIETTLLPGGNDLT